MPEFTGLGLFFWWRAQKQKAAVLSALGLLAPSSVISVWGPHGDTCDAHEPEVGGPDAVMK